MDPQGLAGAGPVTIGTDTTYMGGGIYRKTGVLTGAQVRTLNATPVSMVAAPAASQAIIALGCLWQLDYDGVAAYDAAAAGDTLVARYTGASGAQLVATVPGNTFGGATADTSFWVQGNSTAFQPVFGAAVFAHINTGEWYSAAGNSPIRYTFFYRILDTAI
jgi:hypothetical protein